MATSLTSVGLVNARVVLNMFKTLTTVLTLGVQHEMQKQTTNSTDQNGSKARYKIADNPNIFSTL